MASNADILKCYDFDNLEQYTAKLGNFGEIDKFTGQFLFKECSACKGPFLAHKTCLSEAKTLIWNEEQRSQIVQNIQENFVFQAALAKCDTRISATTCDGCEKRFSNRMIMENHLKIIHNFQGVKMEDKIIVSPWKSTNHQKPQMLMKTPEIPLWTKGMKFVYFKSQIEGWNSDNKETDKKKFDRIVESFKKNSDIEGLKSFVINVVLSKCRTLEKG